MTAFSRLSRFGMTYKPLTETRGEELLTLYRAVFPVRTFPQQEKEQESMEKPLECGEKWRGSFTKYDLDTSSWKTHQCSLLGDLDEFLETWPQWGLMRNGECWEQKTLVQHIRGIESGSLVWIGTPTATMSKRSETFLKGRIPTPAEFVQKWPTPKCQDSRHAISRHLDQKQKQWKGNLGELIMSLEKPNTGGRLNPTWVEWLMGWPLEWTDLKPLEMDKFHCVQQQHGIS